MNQLKVLFFIFLPKKILSKITGFLADMKLPSFVLHPFLEHFVKKHNINMDEYQLAIPNYKTFNDFFTRSLKEGRRTFDLSNKSIISPVDGIILEYGNISKDKLIQVKGVYYSLQDLIKDQNLIKNFTNGNYITIYLDPSMCHRIYNPIQGTIYHYEYIPGKLFPVNEFGRNNFKNLFAVNERLSTFSDTKAGKVGMIKVGATNVGRIKTVYLPKHATNNFFTKPISRTINEYFINKGEELGYFEIGSTVILLFQKGRMRFVNCYNGKNVKIGERIALFK